jgi:CheY-like chemotaxis protein
MPFGALLVWNRTRPWASLGGVIFASRLQAFRPRSFFLGMNPPARPRTLRKAAPGLSGRSCAARAFSEPDDEKESEMNTDLDAKAEAPRILVADDEDEIRGMLVLLLKGEGWLVAEAASGDEALERCRHESFDLAVLDYMMPGMNGLQVARSLRLEGIRLPTVLFTAYLVDELKATCDELGIVAVDKINWDELVLRCRELWERRAEARSYASRAVRRSRHLSPVGAGLASNSSPDLFPPRVVST